MKNSRTLVLPSFPEQKVTFNPDPSFPSMEEMIAAARENQDAPASGGVSRGRAGGGRVPPAERSESAPKPASESIAT